MADCQSIFSHKNLWETILRVAMLPHFDDKSNSAVWGCPYIMLSHLEPPPPCKLNTLHCTVLYCTRLRPKNYVLVQHKIKIAKRPSPPSSSPVHCNHMQSLRHPDPDKNPHTTPLPPPIKEMMILLRWVKGPHPQGQADNGDVDKEKLNGKTCISKTLNDHDDNFTEAVFHGCLWILSSART